MTTPLITRKALPDAEFQEIVPGYFMRLPAEIRVGKTPRPGRNLVYLLRLGHRGGVVLHHVGVEASDGTQVTSADWRAANPFEMWAEVGLWLIKQREEIDGGVRFKAPVELSVEELANLRSRGPGSEDTLRVVADAYNVAEALGIPVSKHVQRVFSSNGKLDLLPRATASAWIRRAKDQGLIREREDAD